MIPFYQDSLVTIYHADFRECSDRLEVSAVITDPPYEETGLAWDKWPEGWPAWVLAHTPGPAALWCWGSLRMFMDRTEEFSGYKLAQDNIWEKPNGSSMLNDRFRRVHEQVAQFYPKRAKWAEVYKSPIYRSVTEEKQGKQVRRKSGPAHFNNLCGDYVYDFDGSRLARSVMLAPSVRFGVKHATPKPVELLRDLVTYSVPPGGAAADIFCGSGSLLVACKELGRHAVGFDADINACREARDRCRVTSTQLAL